MTLVPVQSNGSASKKGLIFIAPFVLLVVSILDTAVWWHIRLNAIFWLFSVLTLASCVIGLISTDSKYLASATKRKASDYHPPCEHHAI